MGLFSFFKKKEKNINNNLSSLNTDNNDLPFNDLPSVSGNDLSLPSLDQQLNNNISSNFSNIDQSGNQNINNQDINNNNNNQTINNQNIETYEKKDTFAQPIGGSNLNKNILDYKNLNYDLDSKNNSFLENKLFFSSDNNNLDYDQYDPYHEEKIDPPRAEDFLVSSDLVKKDNLKLSSTNELADSLKGLPLSSEENKYDLPEIDDEALSEKKIPDDIPYDVFIKGTDYLKVFNEIDSIKKILSIQDEKISQVIETFKKEESTLNLSKDNMESLYKKMLLVDKKVFV